MDPTETDTTPDTTPADTTPDTPVVDDGATPPELEPPRAEPTDADARGLEAMEKGLAAAAKATVGPDGEVNLPPKEVAPPRPRKSPKATDVPRETPVATGADPVPGTPEAAAAAQAPPLVSPDLPPPAPSAAETAINAEMQSLGIKHEGQAARVREIIASNHLMRSGLERMGVTLENLQSELPKLIERHENATQVIQGVLSTGASGEQYGRTLSYLEMAVAANNGNPKAAEAAYAVAMEEANHWAKLMGKEVPGIYDPLAEHPDLLADLEEMNITRERALEIAAFRASQKVSQEREQQREQEQRSHQDVERVAHEAYQELQELDRTLQRDPAYKQFHRAHLDRAVRQIRAQFPPDTWVGRTYAAYDIIKDVYPATAAPAPARGPTSNQPVQTRNRVPGPAGGTPPIEPQIPKDPMAALEMGLASVANRR